MWTTKELGLAAWSESDSGESVPGDDASWFLDARGGSNGIAVMSGRPQNASDSNSKRLLSLSAVDQQALGSASEAFVRGDEYHVYYPQGDGIYELRVVYRVIESCDQSFVLETTIAIQTDRLDTHPTLDIDVMSTSIERVDEASSGSAPITIASDTPGGGSVAVLLGPHDRPFTSDLSDDSRLRLRLFGEFLEKGVIRKARPWFVFAPTGQLAQSDLTERLQALSESPLPLRA